MDDMHGITITTRDRVLRAWENEMELVRDFQNYAQQIEDNRTISTLFAEFAEDEAAHAAKLREILLSMER